MTLSEYATAVTVLNRSGHFCVWNCVTVSKYFCVCLRISSWVFVTLGVSFGVWYCIHCVWQLLLSHFGDSFVYMTVGIVCYMSLFLGFYCMSWLITTFHVVMIESFRVCCSWRQSPATPLLGTFRYMSLHCGWHFCVCYHWRLTVDGRTLHISWWQFLCGVTVDARYLTHKLDLVTHIVRKACLILKIKSKWFYKSASWCTKWHV